MTLHLVKLCVGIDTIEELAAREAQQRKTYKRLAHITRMTPRRGDELLAGGSLYWVIKGYIRVRQLLTKIEPYTDDDGIARCRLHLDDVLVPTRPQARRAFQGWRYLPATDAPGDITPDMPAADMPADMRAELIALGLL